MQLNLKGAIEVCQNLEQLIKGKTIAQVRKAVFSSELPHREWRGKELKLRHFGLQPNALPYVGFSHQGAIVGGFETRASRNSFFYNLRPFLLSNT
jgi:hypothetical protein